MTIVLSESKTEQRLKVHVECRRRQHEEERNGLGGGNFAVGLQRNLRAPIEWMMARYDSNVTSVITQKKRAKAKSVITTY